MAPHCPTDEISCTDHEDGYGEHLEDDPGNHDVCAWCGIAVDLGCLGGGHAAADGLDDEGYDIAGAEDPEVETWLEEGGCTTEETDEFTEEDVDSCCEERRDCGSQSLIDSIALCLLVTDTHQ